MRALVLAIVLTVTGIEASGFYVGGFAGRNLESSGAENTGIVSAMIGYQLPLCMRIEAEFGYIDQESYQETRHLEEHTFKARAKLNQRWMIGGNLLLGLPIADCVELFVGVGLVEVHWRVLATLEAKRDDEASWTRLLTAYGKGWYFNGQFIAGVGVEVLPKTLLAVETRYLTSGHGGYEWLVGLSVRYRL